MRSFEEHWEPKAPHGSAAYWQERAEEARTLRESMHDKPSREMMLDIINLFERMAKSAEKSR